MEYKYIKQNKRQQKKIWLTTVSGSSFYKLLESKTSYFEYALEKIYNHTWKPTKFVKEIMNHGTKCEAIGIDYIEKKLNVKNDIKRSFYFKDLKMSGNVDFLNVEKGFIAEIKTTKYDKNLSFEAQNDTIIRGAIQLWFYAKVMFLITGVFPKDIVLLIINNQTLCRKYNDKCKTKHKIIEINLERDVKRKGELTLLFNLDIKGLLEKFWERVEKETTRTTDKELEQQIEQWWNICALEDDLKIQSKTIQTQIDNQYPQSNIINTKLKELATQKTKLKGLISNDTFYYSIKNKTELVKTTIQSPPRNSFIMKVKS